MYKNLVMSNDFVQQPQKVCKDVPNFISFRNQEEPGT